MWGNKDLLTVQADHIAQVFQDSIGEQYHIRVVLGDVVTPAPTVAPTVAAVGRRRERGRRLTTHDDDTAAAQSWPALFQHNGEKQLAGGGETTVIPSFEDETFGPLFEHGQIRATSCDLDESEQVRMTIFFWVTGPGLYIATAEGLRVINAFSGIHFSAIFGAASTSLCGASVLEVIQVITTSKPTATPATGGNSAGAGGVITSGGGGAGPVSAGGDSSRSAGGGVGEKTKAGLIAVGVIGTMVILFGAFIYARRIPASQGAMVVYPPHAARADLLGA